MYEHMLIIIRHASQIPGKGCTELSTSYIEQLSVYTYGS